MDTSKVAMIGDRAQDIELGALGNIYTVGCMYGYGSQEELRDADIKIDNFKELLLYF